MKTFTSFIWSYSTLFLLLILPMDMVAALHCYDCMHNAADWVTGCDSLNTSITRPVLCAPTETYCKVERIILDNKLLKFYRGCEDVCTPECIVAPGNEKCSSCCQTDLCNVANRGRHQCPMELFNRLSLLLVAILPTVVCYMCCPYRF